MDNGPSNKYLGLNIYVLMHEKKSLRGRKTGSHGADSPSNKSFTYTSKA